jgi:hypothetical protein
VDIFGVICLEKPLVFFCPAEYLAQTPNNPASLPLIQYASGDQRFCVRPASFNVGFDQTAVERKRRVESRECGVSVFLEPSPPEFHALQNTIATALNKTR